MSIEQRGNTYRVRMQANGEKLQPQNFNSRLDAEAWIAEVKAKIAKGLEITYNHKTSGKDITLGVLLDETYNNIWDKQSDWKNTLSIIKQLKDYFGDHTLAKHITLRRLEDFVNDCYRNKNSEGTINRKLAKISKALNYGKDQRYINFVPKIPKQKEVAGEIVWWNKEEEQDILNAIDKINYSDKESFKRFFEWQIDTGMRPIETRKIWRSLVKFNERMDCWTIQLPKNICKWGGGRTIPLTKRAYAAFCSTEDEYPFKQWQESSTRNPWNQVRNELGNKSENFILYNTRHSCATRLLQGGMPIKSVKDWLGHRYISTTEKYAMLVPENLANGLSILDG
jgi:integrase